MNIFSIAFLFAIFVTESLCKPSFREFEGVEFERYHEGTSDLHSISVVFDDKQKKLVLKNETTTPYVAIATLKSSMNETGWSLLKVVTNGSFSDDMQSQAAGMVEGYITADQISMTFRNTKETYCSDDKTFCDKLKKFLDSNSDFAKEMVTKDKTSYWYQVSLIQMQLEGLLAGYQLSNTQPTLTLFDVTLLNIGGDLEDLETALGGRKASKKVLGSGSCSALIKVFPNKQDLAISQVTWNDFNSMMRIYKLYNFSLSANHGGGKKISGQVQSFSSYPGTLYSGDDFYILSSGMVSQETTIGNSNPDLWKYVTTSSVLEWVRSIVANRLAATASEWCSLFERYNSGTYNNQWMVLDYKLFKVGQPIQPDTLWVLEQLPGTVQMADMSVHLEEHGYWASYNTPFFPRIYNLSGTADYKEKFGDFFDYYSTPRAQIFKRDHPKVIDMQSFVKLMRYNDFKHDPLSKCNCTPPFSGENGISARSDLNPADGKYPIPTLGHRRHGGTDCKATNSEMVRSFSQFIVAGPTWDQQPPFQWSKTEWKKPLGHPDIFKFTPALLNWSSEPWISPDE